MYIQAIILSVLIILLPGGNCALNLSYYVKPTIDYEDKLCSTAPYACKTLKEYQELGNFSEFDYKDSNNITTVTLIFLAGDHDSGSILRFSNVDFITFDGYGRTDQVIVKSLDLRIITGTVVIKNITMLGDYIIMYRSSSLENNNRPINIINCKFVAVQMILPNVQLTIENSEFHDSSSTAITLYSSFTILSGNVDFVNNNGTKGGALALIGSTLIIKSDTSVVFRNNHAYETGGAIYADNVEPRVNLKGFRSYCFYMLELNATNVLANLTQALTFENNMATLGGNHIYGATLKSDCVSSSFCHGDYCRFSFETIRTTFKFDRDSNTSWSAVSGDPSRLCICDSSGLPQCTNTSMILFSDIEVFPGQPFVISAVLIGGDFGTTIGTVYAHIHNSNSRLGKPEEYTQLVVNNAKCTDLQYSLWSNSSSEIIYLTATKMTPDSLIQDPIQLDDYITNFTERAFIDQKLLHVPIAVNVTLLPCPPGLTLQTIVGEPPQCNCSSILLANSIECFIDSEGNHLRWDKLIWIGHNNETNNKIMIARCPIDNCKIGNKNINLQKDPDAQCAFNHAGILCGSCQRGYSLAIGSSHCIYCPNNNNLGLFIFFAIAGFLLVITICVLNLTVTQGMINGLMFYANIVWAYQNAFFPHHPTGISAFLKTFLAWLNLDFGIETCFYNGMDMYSKTWLQFIFPFYIAAIFLVGVHYSSKLSKIFGDRSVPTLATLLFLSYAKLLRTIIASLRLADLKTYPQGHTIRVWALDGNLTYSNHKHVLLLLVTIPCFLLLWMPYTVILFSMQWLRKIDHYKPLKPLARYKPIYDAYFGPLKDKHQYWFGVLLLSQGVLLLVSSLTLNLVPIFSLLLLLVIAILLLCYLNHIKTYKKLYVSLIESSFLLNLIVLTAGNLYFRESESGQTRLLCVSASIVFIEFCGIIVWNLIPQRIVKRLKRKALYNYDHDQELDTVEFLEHSDQNDLSGEEGYARYHSSVVDDISH